MPRSEVETRPLSSMHEERGNWPETAHIRYYYEKGVPSARKQDILELCRDLPKHEAPPGFAAWIFCEDLLSDPYIFTAEATRVDNLTHLIHLSDIGIALPIKVDSPNGPVDRFVIGIYEEYRDQIFSDAGQGPENG